jgi:hypothetical protein
MLRTIGENEPVAPWPRSDDELPIEDDAADLAAGAADAAAESQSDAAGTAAPAGAEAAAPKRGHALARLNSLSGALPAGAAPIDDAELARMVAAAQQALLADSVLVPHWLEAQDVSHVGVTAGGGGVGWRRGGPPGTLSTSSSTASMASTASGSPAKLMRWKKALQNPQHSRLVGLAPSVEAERESAVRATSQLLLSPGQSLIPALSCMCDHDQAVKEEVDDSIDQMLGLQRTESQLAAQLAKYGMGSSVPSSTAGDAESEDGKSGPAEPAACTSRLVCL